MSTEWGVHTVEVVAFKIRNKKILHSRPTKRTIRRKRELCSVEIFDQHLPLAGGIDANDLVAGCKLAIFGHTRQGNVEIAIYIERHPVRDRRKPGRIDLRLTKCPIFFDLDTYTVVATTFQYIDRVFVGVD